MKKKQRPICIYTLFRQPQKKFKNHYNKNTPTNLNTNSNSSIKLPIISNLTSDKCPINFMISQTISNTHCKRRVHNEIIQRYEVYIRTHIDHIIVHTRKIDR